MCFPPCNLVQVNDCDRNFIPTQQAAGLQPALPGDQPPVGSDNNRMEQSHFGDTVSKRTQVSQVLPVSEAEIDFLNGQRGLAHRSLRRTWGSSCAPEPSQRRLA